MSFLQNLGEQATSTAAIEGVTGGINYLFGQASANKAYDRQLESWNKQNKYNSPSNQRQLLEDAGLNPALMYSNGSSTGASQNLSSVPQGQTGSSAQDPMTSKQLELMDAQIANVNSDTQKKTAETQTERNTWDVQTSQAELNRSTALLYDSKQVGADLNNQLEQINVNIARATEALTTDNALTTNKLLKGQLEKLSYEVSNAQADLVLKYQQSQREPLVRAQIYNTMLLQNEQMLYIQAQTRSENSRDSLLQKQTSLTEQDIKLRAQQITQQQLGNQYQMYENFFQRDTYRYRVGQEQYKWLNGSKEYLNPFEWISPFK